MSKNHEKNEIGLIEYDDVMNSKSPYVPWWESRRILNGLFRIFTKRFKFR